MGLIGGIFLFWIAASYQQQRDFLENSNEVKDKCVQHRVECATMPTADSDLLQYDFTERVGDPNRNREKYRKIQRVIQKMEQMYETKTTKQAPFDSFDDLYYILLHQKGKLEKLSVTQLYQGCKRGFLLYAPVVATMIFSAVDAGCSGKFLSDNCAGSGFGNCTSFNNLPEGQGSEICSSAFSMLTLMSQSFILQSLTLKILDELVRDNAGSAQMRSRLEKMIYSSMGAKSILFALTRLDVGLAYLDDVWADTWYKFELASCVVTGITVLVAAYTWLYLYGRIKEDSCTERCLEHLNCCAISE